MHSLSGCIYSRAVLSSPVKRNTRLRNTRQMARVQMLTFPLPNWVKFSEPPFSLKIKKGGNDNITVLIADQDNV